MTKNLEFNATIKVKEPTKFPNETLKIPVQVFVTVPAKSEDCDQCINLIIVAFCLVVILLVANIVNEINIRVKKRN